MRAIHVITLSIGLTMAATGNVSARNAVADNANDIIIEGSTTVIPDGEAVILLKNDGNVGTKVASDTVRNGKFRIVTAYDSTEPTCNMSLLCFSPGIPTMPRDLITMPGARITIDATTPYIYTWPVASNVPQQKENDIFMTEAKDLWDKYQQANIDMERMRSDKTLTKESRKAMTDSIMSLTTDINNSIVQREIDMLVKMRHGEAWYDKMTELSEASTYGDTCIYADRLKEIYQSLPAAEKNSAAGLTIARYLYPPAVVGEGDKFADTELRDTEGNTHRIADSKGKWILLDFWSAGCGPCIMAIPELKQLASDHKDLVEVISISTDSENIWKKATERHNLSGNNLNDPAGRSGLYLNYGIEGIPTFVVIDPEGTIRNKWMGYSKGIFERKLRPWLSPRPAMSVTENGNSRLVDYPESTQNSTEGTLEIDRIEMTPDSTIVTFHAYYTPGWWISISPESWIDTPDGKKYKVLSAKNIVLGEKYVVGPDGQGVFTLTFPPLPAGTKTIDFHEGPESKWKILNLRTSE